MPVNSSNDKKTSVIQSEVIVTREVGKRRQTSFLMTVQEEKIKCGR